MDEGHCFSLPGLSSGKLRETPAAGQYGRANGSNDDFRFGADTTSRIGRFS
jgi:hypothetical protein